MFVALLLVGSLSLLRRPCTPKVVFSLLLTMENTDPPRSTASARIPRKKVEAQSVEMEMEGRLPEVKSVDLPLDLAEVHTMRKPKSEV